MNSLQVWARWLDINDVTRNYVKYREQKQTVVLSSVGSRYSISKSQNWSLWVYKVYRLQIVSVSYENKEMEDETFLLRCVFLDKILRIFKFRIKQQDVVMSTVCVSVHV